ncbi:MAG: TIGR02449 family protein [Methylococcales bacterium]
MLLFKLHSNIEMILTLTALSTMASENNQLQILEEKLDSLIQMCNSITEENELLKIKQAELIREKSKLIEKTILAKTKVESMITRLKSMEHM